MSLPRRAPRWALALLLAVAGAAAILVVSDGEEANGGPDAAAAAAGWSPLAPSPLSRTEVGGARIGDSIYVVGGFLPGTAETTEQVARFHIPSGSWELAAPMPVAVNHPAVAAHRGRLYVHGGYTADGGLTGETDALQRYDPATGEWTRLRGSGTPRGAHVLVSTGKRLYSIGGAAPTGNPLRLVQRYDAGGDRWLPGPPLPTAREHIAAAAVGRRIYVLGGRSPRGNLGVVERLDTRTGEWARLPRLRVPRSGFGASRVGPLIVAVGGEELTPGGKTIAPVEVYDTRSERWRRLPPMPTARHGLAVAGAGRSVFAIEGGPTPGLAFSSANEVLRVPKRLLRKPRGGGGR